MDRLMQPWDMTEMRKVSYPIASHVHHIGHQNTSVIIEIDPMTVQLRVANRGQAFSVFRPLQLNLSSSFHHFYLVRLWQQFPWKAG